MSTQMAMLTNASLAGAAASPPSLTTFRACTIICCEGAPNDNVGGLREAVDRATKKNITKDEILHNQETNGSEQKSVLGVKPKPGTVYSRPETGSKTFFKIFAFDGALPELVNGCLAMVGITWAFLAEIKTGLTVYEQLFYPGQAGLLFFLGSMQLITYASLVPVMNGSRRTHARAERWNGRLAMVGFLSLLITEAFTHSPVFHCPVF